MAISTKGLVKRFGEEVLAVDSIDLSIPTNTTYVLLGPNGAGKTTTVSTLTTLIEPTSGRAQVTGLDVVQQADQVRQPQPNRLPNQMRVSRWGQPVGPK
jgi:ABC-2 type transport system ATP-binding protein